jgi:Mpv17 / PMP22 family
MARSRSFPALLLLSLLTFQSSVAFPRPSFYSEASLRASTAISMLPHFECATAAAMSGLGDILAQQQSKSAEPYRLSRTFKFMLKGLGEGLLWSMWYRRAELWSVHLTAAVTASFPNPVVAKIVNTFISVLLDLTVACPIIYSCCAFTMSSCVISILFVSSRLTLLISFKTGDIPFPALLNGMPIRKIPGQIKSKIGEMLVASFKVWTPVNVVIYNVPLRHRVLLMSVADVFWQSIVSSITTATKHDPVGVAVSVAKVKPANSTITSSSNGAIIKPTLKVVPAAPESIIC